MLYIGSGLTPGYLPTAQSYGYLQGIERLAANKPEIMPFCVLLGFPDERVEELEWMHPSVRFIRMEHAELKTHNPKSCLQHGEFLAGLERAFKLNEDDSVLFTDADIRVQRDLTGDELELLTSDRVLVSMNWHDQETLAEELSALMARVVPEVIRATFPNYDLMRCFNTGVLGMKVWRWRELFALYCCEFPLIDPMLAHYAKQQWLVCWILQHHRFPLVDPLSEAVRNLHCHGHHPRAPQDNRLERRADGVVHRKGVPILFSHRLG